MAYVTPNARSTTSAPSNGISRRTVSGSSNSTISSASMMSSVAGFRSFSGSTIESVPSISITSDAPKPSVSAPVTDRSLYPYLIRYCILNYRSQPRFRNSNKEVNGSSSLSPLNTKTHSKRPSIHELKLSPQTSLSGDSGPLSTSSISSFGDSKFPKEALKLLQVRLKRVALKEENTINEPLLRRSFLAFYAMLLSPELQRQVKESRRVEDLVMWFLSCAVKELQKNSISPKESKPLVDQQAAAFVRFLISTVQQGGLAGSYGSLLRQLESYEASLKSTTLALQPQTTNNIPYNLASNVSLGYIAGPTFELSDMVLAKNIGSLLLVADSEIQKDINEMKKNSTEHLAISELLFIQSELEKHDRNLTYSRSDFSSDSDYQSWKNAEVSSISQHIDSMGISVTAPDICTDLAHLYFIPPNPHDYFKLILKRCLERDLEKADRSSNSTSHEAESHEKNGHLDNILIISKASTDLLTGLASLWRISRSARSVILLQTAQQFFSKRIYDCDKLKDAFNVAKYVALGPSRTTEEWDPLSWPKRDLDSFASTLEAIYYSIIDLLKDALNHIFEPKSRAPKISPYLGLLYEYVFSNDSVINVDSLMADKKVHHKLEEAVKTAAENKYDQLIDDIPRDHTLDPLHIIDLADKIIGISKTLQKRYPNPIFETIFIPHLSTERHLTLFSADSYTMFRYIMQHMKSQNEEHSFEDVITLYKKLVEIRDLYVQVSNKPFSFDLETSFAPYVTQWADISSSLAVSWVDPAIEGDKFESIDSSNIKLLHSSSVGDIFSAFRSAVNVVTDLQWRNEFHKAQFYAILMRGISTATCKYASIVFSLFVDDLKLQDEQHKQVSRQAQSRQEKWLAMARNAITSREIPASYHFLQGTCVKLNNIEYAQIELDKLETSIDSEKQANLIAKFDDSSKKKKASSFIFTVKVIQAEGLKACDMNGLSDPYVTLIDQQTRKQIGKTRTIYEDLNPIWDDEIFEVTTTGPKWLAATVWDENTISNHDLCGRAFVRLDPNAFHDFGSQDFWLDLDTQGRLQVNISMESERDDIRFHFGKSMRTLMRTEDDMIRMIVNKFTAFISYSISLQTLKSLLNINKFGIETVSNWLSSTRITGGNGTNSASANKPQRLTQVEIEDSLNPLFDYLNENFKTLAQGLTPEMKIKVMTKAWTVVINTIEMLLIPPLSDRRTSQQQLSAAEADIVFTWLSAMRDFFHHDGAGPSLEILQSHKYQELMTIPVYYDLSTSELKQECDKMASLSFKVLQDRNYVAVPEAIRRKNTVMAHRNRTVVKKQREKVRDAQRESPRNEDIILRILRLRGEYDYLSRRLRQRERIAHTLATESVVKTAAGFRRGFNE